MSKIFNIPKYRVDNYGRPIITSNSIEDFKHLIGYNINDILLFDNGTDELRESGAIILPRFYFLFVGNKDGEVQYKPYEFNQYRIEVATYKYIIIDILSIG